MNDYTQLAPKRRQTNDYPQLAPKQLTLVCSKCTRQKTFGVAPGQAGIDASSQEIARAGWIRRGELTVCPRCPQSAMERASHQFGSATKESTEGESLPQRGTELVAPVILPGTAPDLVRLPLR